MHSEADRKLSRDWPAGYHKIMETLHNQTENTTGSSRLAEERQLSVWQTMQASDRMRGGGGAPLLGAPISSTNKVLSARVNMRQVRAADLLSGASQSMRRILHSDPPRMRPAPLNGGDQSPFRII